MGIELSWESQQVAVAFGGYLVGILLLSVISHRYLSRGSFVKEYFIGNRGLGPWVLALTVAATAISGGTFMGFPSLIYTNGWIMALWICSYMVVPLTTLALFGKRINQVARLSGAVTVPDVLRDRFQSPALGLLASVLILFFLTFYLVPQFRAGGLVVEQALLLKGDDVALPITGAKVNFGYLVGLLLFSVTVVGYTTYGGFWAVTWNDVLQGLVMLVGVLLMAGLALRLVPPLDGHEGLAAATEHLRRQDPALVYGPGPKDFLPLGSAFSFFLMWSLMSAGQPSGMVRLMSFKDAASARRALLLIAGYYLLTYLSLLVVFICARAILPTEYLGQQGSEGEPDSIMPAMARKVTADLPGGALLAGLLLAAPYAAIMSTVAALLLMISSSLVRDIYQRSINPQVSARTIKTASYLVTALVGGVVLIGALHPPQFLQYLIVFAGSGQGCSFLVPMALCLYWSRATWQGVLASMLGGFLTVIGLYVLGWLDSHSQAALARTNPPLWAEWAVTYLSWLPDWGRVRTSHFLPLNMGGVDPLVWGLVVSLVLGIAVSLWTRPDEELVKKYFGEKTASR